MKRPSNAPGCFGIGVVSMMNTKHCSKCPVKSSCSDQAVIALHEASKTVDVGDYLAIHKVTPKHTSPTIARHHPSKKMNLRKIDGIELKMLFTLPVKARKVARTILAKNINLKECLAKNVNPFENATPHYLDLAFEFILSRQNFEKRELAEVYAQKGWAEGTVRAAIADATSIMTALEVIECEYTDQYWVLRND